MRNAALPTFLITEFLGKVTKSSDPTEEVLATVRTQQSFAVAVDKLFLPAAYEDCKLDVKGRIRPHSQRKRKYCRQRATVNTFAVLVTPPLAGRIVRLKELVREVDEQLVAATIDCDPSLCGELKGEHCYHAGDISHMARFGHPAESACERRGSLLHHLFHAEQNLST